ncbi:MAG: ferritin-like domain-containing protein [Actinomycetota bacterium]|nr:ferritin-like domain-containing protein [Actinomycetota bacterium]
MSFDIVNYSTTARRVVDDDVDYSAFTRKPLPETALRALQYMSDVESHTICYLRDLLVTPSHQDPEITTFLTMWVYEEFWHGEVLDKVLAAHGREVGPDRIRRIRLAQGRSDRMSPIYQAVAANLVGDDFIAVHMTFGAINEWSTYAGYGRLLAQTDHPELTKLVGRIQRQETRHVAFYASQARERLELSRAARLLTRLVLRVAWTPVGSGIMPAAETRFLLRYLMGEVDGARMIRQIDEKIDRLPGLAGMHLVSRAAARYGVGPDAATLATGPVQRAGSMLWSLLRSPSLSR